MRNIIETVLLHRMAGGQLTAVDTPCYVFSKWGSGAGFFCGNSLGDANVMSYSLLVFTIAASIVVVAVLQVLRRMIRLRILSIGESKRQRKSPIEKSGDSSREF